MVLEAKDKIEYSFPIFNINYLKENGEDYFWEIGNYTISFTYLYTEPDVISNQLEFKIVD